MFIDIAPAKSGRAKRSAKPNTSEDFFIDIN